MKLARSQVALGILAGGQARRLGGADKALAQYEGRQLAERTLAAVGPGHAETMLSYNRGPAAAMPADLRAIPDLRVGFPGPLAGIEALLAACNAAWLLTVPVDLAQIPVDLFERLDGGLADQSGVRAQDGDGNQPLVALWPVLRSRAAVGAALDARDQAVHRVQATLGFAACDFSPLRFGNLNSPADFHP